MEKTQYTLYLQSIIDLVRSFVIVSKDIAIVINQSLMENGVNVNKENPTTWKYYMNLNGEYHPSDGAPIKIISRDTYKEIEFTKKGIDGHPLTREAYKPHTEPFKQLIDEYPDKVILITGILFPIPINESIKAKNYSLLAWDDTLIEYNEHDLISDIQSQIDGYILRHHNPSYIEVDNLYLSSLMGVLYQWLIPIVLELRLSNCKTNKAHSFHIWSLLASYDNLDRRRYTLTKEQALYLYRNIDWITANVGSTIVFNDLTRVFMTASGLPLYGYDIKHTDEKLLDDLRYSSLASRYRVDEAFEIANVTESKTIEDLVLNMVPSARDNKHIITKSQNDVISGMEHSHRNIYPTKVLESEIVNGIENEEIELTELAINHWAAMSCTNRFTSTIELTHLPSNINSFFKTHDALALFIYITSVALDHRLTEIPDFKVQTYRRFEDIDYVLLRNLSSELTDKWINELINNQIEVISAPSVVVFNDLCIRLRKSVINSRLKYFRLTKIHERAEGELLTSAFWSPGLFTLPSATTSYKEFFDAHLIDETLLTPEICIDLIPVLFKQVTGFDYNASTIFSAIQSNILGLMEQLSSYNVQYIGSYALANTVPIRWCLFRADETDIAVEIATSYILLAIIRILALFTSIETELPHRPLTIKNSRTSTSIYSKELLDVIIRPDLYNTLTSHANIKILRVTILAHEAN